MQCNVLCNNNYNTVKIYNTEAKHLLILLLVNHQFFRLVEV